MLRDPSVKYRAFPQIDLPNRQWPSQSITKAPRWLSTDLRDGNQALADPMDADKKQRFFDMLVKIGLKEIEVGFPSAGATEFDFISGLVRQDRIPEDVMVQVLTQSRRDLIQKTFESLEGARTATVHLYNAVSPAWREVVFNMDRAGVKALAIEGAKMLREEAEKRPDTDWRFEYSPETFSTAELDFSLEVCEAVQDILEPTVEKPIIFNLPATVECSTPNIYADQIEWMIRNLSRREAAIISLHPHNDRGTGVAAAELGLMAGADRIEGCIFGNGERTGNVDLVTLALNMYTQGVSPELDFSDMEEIVKTVEYCNQIPVHPRHPYAGELVFTAFSGSHQDAIKKGFEAQEKRNDQFWNVPYLPIDPADIGASYEAVIRVNSQSGKGGMAWVLQQDKGLRLPKAMQADFSRAVQKKADEVSRELTSADIWDAFQKAYRLEGAQYFELMTFSEQGRAKSDGQRVFTGDVKIGHKVTPISGRGNGLISALLDGIREAGAPEFEIIDYQEHAIGAGTDARAAAYVQCKTKDGRTVFGAGMDSDVATASARAVISAANSVLAA
ncbi:2-isopropylmalate synthase [Brevundimonas terrae]|uniref:2-isopropylmalate synthase n=1 Tax=Brevundimonas terrae TaxID=363631 RepID=A0ABP3I030_9CAUL|nr:2-isopropylmalate synthase [Brevundimonas terrae]NIJ25300.1 2-isopropylmalate synthase [Brevundimonas terrae]